VLAWDLVGMKWRDAVNYPLGLVEQTHTRLWLELLLLTVTNRDGWRDNPGESRADRAFCRTGEMDSGGWAVVVTWAGVMGDGITAEIHPAGTPPLPCVGHFWIYQPTCSQPISCVSRVLSHNG